ncbi:hypothetical protein CXG53_01865 [Pseudomonas guariconensis]|uniref:Uncharacterized protein n=1 Tax=Pseudomonas guariconensis TaxID=1288410 RepID=A0AAX0W2M2_9PSED|nr:hypothetical protein CXG49_01865 [Pseudomonas guariconensis]PLV26190.1 hypothetical protein CXG53_01865 [Pseudomonas guariconensis]PLV31265.1 hypothetical protein CXG51_01865 [Pseudomonas guariconensis]
MATFFFACPATSGRQHASLVAMLAGRARPYQDAYLLLLWSSLSGIKQRSFLGARSVAQADSVDRTPGNTAPGAID